MSDLERRYQLLVRLFYPGGYGRARETELVGTYLDLAEAEKTRPRLRDVADLATGGAREHLRVSGLRPGLNVAGVLAMITAVALAATFAVYEMSPAPPEWEAWGYRKLGPFFTVGGWAWAVWLLAAIIFATGRVGWSRAAIGLAMVATAATVPLAALTGLGRPALFVVLPQLMLGVVALGAGRYPLWVRLLPAAGAVAIMAALSPRVDGFWTYYGWSFREIPTMAGAALLIVTALVAAALATRGDARGGSALLILIGPIGLLSLHELAANLAGAVHGSQTPDRQMLAATAVLVGVVAVAALLLALNVRRRLGATRKPATDREPAAQDPRGADRT
jgi:hypothetical protein